MKFEYACEHEISKEQHPLPEYCPRRAVMHTRPIRGPGDLLCVAHTLTLLHNRGALHTRGLHHLPQLFPRQFEDYDVAF